MHVLRYRAAVARRRRWREPLLAFTGIALAIGSAGVGVLVVDRVREDDGILVYSSGRTSEATEPAGTPVPTRILTATPEQSAEPETETATAPPATPTRAQATATPTRRPATPTATRPAATATRTQPATPSRTPTPTATSASGLNLTKTSFSLPGDATANGGGTIGPFCCQGRTVTLVTSGGETVGYAYWYKWLGQAYNLPRDGGFAGALPDIQVLIHDPTAGESSIAFSVAEAVAGATKTADVGRLRFTVTITSAEATTYEGANYVWESSLAATLTVQAR